MELKNIDFIGNTDVQETIIVMEEDVLNDSGKSSYALALEPVEDRILLYRIYNTGDELGISTIDDHCENPTHYCLIGEERKLCLVHSDGEIIREVDISDENKYATKTILNGGVISAPLINWIKTSVLHKRLTGQDINLSYIEDSKEYEEFAEAARGVHSSIKSVKQLQNQDKYRETYERLLPKFKHLLKEV